MNLVKAKKCCGGNFAKFVKSNVAMTDFLALTRSIAGREGGNGGG